MEYHEGFRRHERNRKIQTNLRPGIDLTGDQDKLQTNSISLNEAKGKPSREKTTHMTSMRQSAKDKQDEHPFLIPWKINLALMGLVISLALALIYIAAASEGLQWKIGLGIAFSYVLLTNYGLLHEATHANFHPKRGINYLCGFLTGILFPVPFTMIRYTHQGHHDHNRTDAEMFDLYYDHDNRLYKYWIWYGTLTGGFWPLVPCGAILVGLLPKPVYLFLFRSPPWRNPSLLGLSFLDRWKIRGELIAIVACFTLIAWSINWNWLVLGIFYACFAVNWSTRQYVGHAFSPRSIIDGAWNLRHFRWMEWILLRSNWDLNHHRRPDIPWIHLNQVPSSESDRKGYLQVYWSQWLGPRRTSEPAPHVEPAHPDNSPS